MLYISISAIIIFDALARKSSYRNYESASHSDEVEYPRYDESPRMPSREEIPREPSREEYHSPIEDERVRKEFEEWKEYRRLTTTRSPAATSMPEEAPKRVVEEKRDEEYEAAVALGDIKRRKFGEEQDLDANDKWYELLRGEIPDEEFNVRR